MLGRFIREGLSRLNPGRDERFNPAAEKNEEGIRHWQQGEFAQAEQCFRDAIATRASYAAAHSNLGMVLVEQRRLDEGLAMLLRAVELDDRHAGVRVNLANTLAYDGQTDNALAHFEAALSIDPSLVPARLNVVKPWLDTCDWGREDEVTTRLQEISRGAGLDWTGEVLPFVALMLDLSPETQLAVARAHAAVLTQQFAPARPTIAAHRPTRSAGDKIRIGYASGDFRNNAVAHQMAGMFEAHDRRRFEIHAYSWAVDDGSPWRRRIEAGCDRFVDIREASHIDGARRIAVDGVDVLVSLAGFGGSARNEIFALRPAPVQLQWLGYPGSMGADFIDYVVADGVVLPQGNEAHFSEAVARLPVSYQVNDDGQSIDEAPLTRREFGLSDQAFIFCAFNQSYKIDRRAFACWMRVLGGVPGSQLWLIAAEGRTRMHLRAAARGAGIDPERLVFATALPKARHLARHRLADLFLDTWRINGGTTASDALWAGLPVLALAGDRFGKRVAASLLHELRLDDLIARDERDYENKALNFARDAAARAQISARLAEERRQGNLFNTRGFTMQFERALERMVERQRSGLPPQSFDL
jgi:protein O-GlcNAc transferase